ncbi:MAG: hypothetical protein N2595_02105 [bacterium]|nr:hypothetical protein [bacterium]
MTSSAYLKGWIRKPKEIIIVWVCGIILAHGQSLAGRLLCPGLHFDTCGVTPPTGSNLATVAQFLDLYPEVLLHARTIVACYEAAPEVDWLAFYEQRARKAATPLQQFDLAVAQLVHGVATNDFRLTNTGLTELRSLCERSDHAGMWLAYAVFLAYVDVAQFGRSPHSMSPMKAAVTQAIARALAAHTVYPQRTFPHSLSAALSYLNEMPAYASWVASLDRPTGVNGAAVHYWNGLLCVRGSMPAVGAGALAAASWASLFLLDCVNWRIVLQVPMHEEYAFVADGEVLALRRGGAGYLYRARDGTLIARIPRLSHWEFTADGAVAALRNVLSPPGSYDIELIDLRTGAPRASLYRDCAMEVRVQHVAVTRDGRYAAVQYRLENGDHEVDIWDLEAPTLCATLATRGALPVGFTPDNQRLVRKISPVDCVVEELSSLRSDVPSEMRSGVRIHTRIPADQYVFLNAGAAMLCWAQRRSPCDAWILADTRQGTILAARKAEPGFSGCTFVNNGSWFATWRGTAIELWSLAHGARPRLAATLTLARAVRAAALSAQTALLAAADAHGCLYLWQLERTGPRAWSPWATGDHSIDWLSFDLRGLALYAYSHSNQTIYVAPLKIGGFLDSRSPVGWNPLTRPVLPHTPAPSPLPPPPRALSAQRAAALPPLQDTAYYAAREWLTIDHADLDCDGMEELLVSARGNVRTLAPGVLYFADGRAVHGEGDAALLSPSNDYWYGVLAYDPPNTVWKPLLMGVSERVPEPSTTPFVTCRFVTFSNGPGGFVEHVIQHSDGTCSRTLYAANSAGLTAVFQYVYHLADADILYDAARSLISITEPLYPMLSHTAAHVPLLFRTTRFLIAERRVSRAETQVQLAPDVSPHQSETASAELLEYQDRATRGEETWRLDPLAYAQHFAPQASWQTYHNDGTVAVVRATTPTVGVPEELVLYRPFLSRGETSIWHHVVSRVALPTPAQERHRMAH